MGYHLTFTTEGNTVGNVVEWFGNVDCWTEEGTPIRITHRNQVKNVVIRLRDYGFQYKR